MTIEALGIIDRLLTDAGINYEYYEWTSDLAYPYWVGEYQEVEPLNEDGMSESTFIMSGFTRGTAFELEQDKEKIKNCLMRHQGNWSLLTAVQRWLFFMQMLFLLGMRIWILKA